MTQDEAKHKWCPMFQGWKSTVELDSEHYKCKASACMMWRWRFKDNGMHPCEHSDTDGYCGLAGKL